MTVEDPNSDDIKNKIRIFQLNDEKAEFEELELDADVEISQLLKSEVVLYFIQPKTFRSYIWAGSQASTRMKFIAANAATRIRDKIGPAIKISTIEEDDEPKAFKILIGIEEAIDYEEEQTGPAYEGRIEDEVLLEEMSLEKILLTLEKLEVPENSIREMVIVGDEIYGYHETYKKYFGELIKERKLYPLEESIPDGMYRQEDLYPRILMSHNRVVLIELFRNMTPKEIEEVKMEEKKFFEIKQAEKPFAESESTNPERINSQ
ncbi:MAG: hypothetical protein K9W44_11970 [Candidatus Lokiarchaeota archaeon]|nr:hypothetical protein [Candidatus Harpocratesius repetitus]